MEETGWDYLVWCGENYRGGGEGEGSAKLSYI